jgi:DNA repair protein RecO (recombination protein O)
VDEIEAIVVGRTDVGEADRVVRLLTPGLGRVDVIARGARASRRRFGGALEVGTRIRASWRRGRGELPVLVAADVIRAPHRARDAFGRLVLLVYGCDVVATLSEHGLEAERGFGLLERWLELVEGEAAPGDASRVALEAKALTFSGLTPRLTTCAVCGAPLAGRVRFDAESGGGVHPWCGPGAEVDAADLVRLETLRRAPLADTPGGTVPVGARWLLATFLEHHARRPLRSRALLGAEDA